MDIVFTSPGQLVIPGEKIVKKRLKSSTLIHDIQYVKLTIHKLEAEVEGSLVKPYST